MSKFFISLRIVLRSVWGNPGNKGQLAYRTFRALRWQLAKRLSATPRPQALASGAKMMLYPDCYQSSSVVYADWLEYHEIQFLRRRLRRGQVVVDVGANVGRMLLLLADVGSPELFFAFEPTPLTFRRLQENWRLNGWPQENLFQAAAGAQPGTMFIADVAVPKTTNSVHATRTGDNEAAVAVKVLDELAGGWGKTGVGLLIIDVEGFEPEVFAGATKLLCEVRPRLVMFESLDGRLDPRIAEILGQARYRVFQLDAQGQVDAGHTNAENLFAAPVELFDEIASLPPR